VQHLLGLGHDGSGPAHKSRSREAAGLADDRVCDPNHDRIGFSTLLGFLVACLFNGIFLGTANKAGEGLLLPMKTILPVVRPAISCAPEERACPFFA
jgi:hypothetical protein